MSNLALYNEETCFRWLFRWRVAKIGGAMAQEPINPHDLFAVPKACALFFGTFAAFAIIFPRKFIWVSGVLSKIPIIGHRTGLEDEPFFRSATWGRICGIIFLIITAVAIHKIHNQ